jgi:hypothetical protein
VTIVARDAHRAKEFYQAVLQVPFSCGHTGAWCTDQTAPPLGIRPSHDAEAEVELSDASTSPLRWGGPGWPAAAQTIPSASHTGRTPSASRTRGATFRLWQPADGPKS